MKQDDLPQFFDQGFPSQVSGLSVEMTKTFLPGGIEAMNSRSRNRRFIVRGQARIDKVTSKVIKAGLGICGQLHSFS